jgi:hypothetical protein
MVLRPLLRWGEEIPRKDRVEAWLLRRPVSVMVQFTLRYAGKRVEERWDSFCALVAGD